MIAPDGDPAAGLRVRLRIEPHRDGYRLIHVDSRKVLCTRCGNLGERREVINSNSPFCFCAPGPTLVAGHNVPNVGPVPPTP